MTRRTTPPHVENVGMPTFPYFAPTILKLLRSGIATRLVAPATSRHSTIDVQQSRLCKQPQSSRCQQVVAATTKNVGMPTFPIRDSEVRP
jgi:hypothetical protein